jgi:hypothetical protein
MSYIPLPEQIKPKKNGVSDFFSWQLYKYMKKYKNPSEFRVWLATWDDFYGVRPSTPRMYIGGERDGRWIHARKLRSLCITRQKIERYAYGSQHDTENWIDVTEAFWSDYLKKGVCAIHGDNSHKWNIEGDLRTCEYCGKQERKKIIMKPTVTWGAV